MSETTHALAKHGKIDLPKRNLWQIFSANLVKSGTRVVGGVHLDDLGSLAFWLALLFLVCNAVVFAAVLYLTTISVLSKKFLSLAKDTQGATCVEVPQQLNGMFQGDTNGYWQTSDQFNATRSLFQLTFTGRGVTNLQFRDAMTYFTANLTRWGKISVTRNSLWSLNTWASFTLVHPQTKLQFNSNVDAGIVFSGVIQSARFVSSNGSCGGQGGKAFRGKTGGYFDGSNKQIVMRQPTPRSPKNRNKFLSVCPAQMSEKAFNNLTGQVAASNLGYFDYGFDVRMISLIVGLNTGTITLDGLLRIDNDNSRQLGIVGYIDTSYNPPMPYPIYCLDKPRAKQRWGLNLSPQQMSGPEICFIFTSLKTNKLYLFYPYVEKVRLDSRRQSDTSQKNLEMYVACKCPKDKMDNGGTDCNDHVYAFTIIYDQKWNRTRAVQMAASFQQIIVSDAGGKSSNPLGDHLSGLVAYGRGSGSISGAQRLKTPLNSFTDKEGKFWDWSFAKGRTFNDLLRDEFQKVCGGKCAMIYFVTKSTALLSSVNTPFNRFDLSLAQLNSNASLVVLDGVGQNKRTVPSIMCVDTFSQPQALARLSQAPPIKLVQSYFECTNTLSAAFMASVGNAAATSTLYVGIGWAIFGVIFVFYLNYSAHSGTVVLTEDTKSDLEATQAQIRNELIFEGLRSLSEELVRKKVISESAALIRLDSFRPLFYEQHDPQGPEEQEALERVGSEISSRLHQAKQACANKSAYHGDGRIQQADEKGSSAPSAPSASEAGYRGSDGRIQPRHRASISLPNAERQSFTGMHGDPASSDGRRGSRRLSAHPMGFVLSSVQPRSRASLVSSLVLRNSVTETHQL